ncbi:hypothetical protein Micbo1qcDRAFT_232914 [Microdochium bolleyi]|uniref:Rhodopsin domain-containing protein n=1 Tax=Microdochium bolleyi TaxID=196109 RepID=A0A136J872_9PEZI|nr:hypothetical protein Micbo1qcDRAFT_232914 [Microdochium bolleyi]
MPTWNPDVNPDNRIIWPPHGLPLAVIVNVAIFVVLSTAAIGLRVFVRAKDKVFGWDDGVMVAGGIGFICASILAIWAELVGIGTFDIHLNQWQWEQAKKIDVAWLLVYCIPMTVVKASICLTLRRVVGTKRNLRRAITALLGVLVVSFCAAVLGTILQCRPFEAHWRLELVESGEGKCAAESVFVALGFIASFATIGVDAALVVIPAMVLWKTNMNRSAKLQVFGMLSVGSTASIITIIRIPYVRRYNQPNDSHWVGILASSFPSMRRLFLAIKNEGSYASGAGELSAKSGPEGLITFGGTHGPRSKNRKGVSASHERFRNPTDLGISLTTVQGRQNSSWTRLQDGDSDKETILPKDNAIRAEYTFSVQVDAATDADSDHSRPGRAR